jgi:hypothetical protein
MNCRQTGVTSLNVRTTNGSILDVKMNLEKAEGLCFPLLFPHGEAGYTNNHNDFLSPSQYAMARMIRPEKINGQYMTAVARYSYNP